MKQVRSSKAGSKRPSAAAAGCEGDDVEEASQAKGAGRGRPPKLPKVQHSNSSEPNKQQQQQQFEDRASLKDTGKRPPPAAAAGALSLASSSIGYTAGAKAGCSPWVLLSPPGVADDQLEGQLVLHVDASDPQQQLQYTLVTGQRLQGVTRFSKVWAGGLQVVYMDKHMPCSGEATELGRDGYMFHCVGCGEEGEGGGSGFR